MADKVSAEKAKQLVSKLPGVLAAKRIDLKKLERQRVQTIQQIERLHLLMATVDGGMAATRDSINVLEAMLKECGLEDLAVETVAKSAQEMPAVEPVVDSAYNRRRKAGKLCCFKAQKEDGSTSWCARSLRSKPQKTEGFCSVHFSLALGKSEAAWKKEKAKN